MVIFDRVILLMLGIWALVYGLLTVTNIQVESMRTIAGVCALCLGIVCIIRAVMSFMVVQQVQPPH